ncbi:MAG: tyrosine-type recombinase/integrase [Candidatus Acidiferrales bacterium]
MARKRYQKGSLRLRGKKWALRWREDVVLADGTVRRIEKTTVLGTMKEFPTQKLAQRAADSVLSRVNRFDYRPVKRATFAEIVALWQKEVSSLLKPSTARAMASHLRFHLLPFFGRDPLDEIGPERVQTFIGKLAKGRSRHTILNVLGTLWSIRKMARRWGYVVNDVRHADLVIPASRPSRPSRFFTAEQVRSILSFASEPWRTMFALAAMAGLRAGEVLGLSVDDLDFEQRLIFVRRSAWHGRLFSPKSAGSVAAVPMPEPLAEMLTNYLASWRPNEKRLLFPNRRGNPYSANKVVQKRLWPILDSLSIPRCGMHAFRHSHASLLVSSGASPKVAQMQLRHSDPAITMRVYAHVLGSEQRDAAEKVARQLWPDVATFFGKSQYAN